MFSLNRSLKAKIYLPMTIIFAIMLGVMFIFFWRGTQAIEKKVLADKEKQMSTFAKESLQTKYQLALVSAINLSQNGYIINALKTGDKAELKSELKKLNESIKQSSEYKNLRIHIHSADIKSFLRGWNDKNGDDLSGFRKTIIEVKTSKAPVCGLEVGKAGLVIRGLAPIITQGEYLGSVEVILPFDDIIKSIDNDLQASAIIGMNASLLKQPKP